MQIKLDDGFFFGLGAFETIAVENGHAQFLPQHLARLVNTLHFLGIEKSLHELTQYVQVYLDLKNLNHHALKLTVSAKNILLTHRINPYPAKRHNKSFIADFSSIRRNQDSPWVYHKTLNYGECLLEHRKAQAKCLDELIFINTKNEITEGTCTNIFFSKGTQLYTPPVLCGLLPGIMRAAIIKRLNALETVIHPQDLTSFDCCYLTNSLLGWMPVRSLAGHRFTIKALPFLPYDS